MMAAVWLFNGAVYGVAWNEEQEGREQTGKVN
jgi:hypothetical protein